MIGYLMRMRVEKIAKKLKNAAGMSLVELIVGLAISSVVSIMAAQFFSMAVRLHRTSTEMSNLQKDAQLISSQLDRAIMSTEELYYFDNGSENFLLLGRFDNSGASVSFEGQIFYFDRYEKKFYMDTAFEAPVTKSVLFNSLRAQSEIGRLKNPEYLVSNKVEDVEYSLSQSINDMKNLGNRTYVPKGKFTVSVGITMQYRESKKFEQKLKIMPRAGIKEITWN